MSRDEILQGLRRQVLQGDAVALERLEREVILTAPPPRPKKQSEIDMEEIEEAIRLLRRFRRSREALAAINDPFQTAPADLAAFDHVLRHLTEKSSGWSELRDFIRKKYGD